MKVNKMPFLLTISRAIKFGTVAWLKNAKANTILANIQEVRNVYIKGGFLLEIIEADGQFEPLCGAMAEMGITLIGVPEKNMCLLPNVKFGPSKKGADVYATPGMLIVQMVSTCNSWLDIFLPKDGVSRNINPRELMTGVKIDYNKHIQAEFGEYVQVHEEHDNTMRTRTTGAIATKPTGNVQGGHWFYSPTTGRMLDRRKWTPLPMPGDVIERINTLAKASPVSMHFTNMRNIDYPDDNAYDSDEDSDYDSNNEPSDDEDEDYTDFIARVDRHNLDPLDPPDESANETNNNDAEETSDDKNEGDDFPNDDAEETSENDDAEETSENETDDPDPVEAEAGGTLRVPMALRKLTDWSGAMPPTIQSRTRQNAHDNGESLLAEINTEEWTTVTKKQRKLKKVL
jgi:hypothetical protein